MNFQAVYDQFHPKIRGYLRQMVGQGEADDLTQEVFVKVSQALPRFRGESSLSTWVYRIATNTAFDRMRTRAFQQPPEPLDSALPAQSSAIDETLVREEMNDCIGKYVDRLPPSYRAVVVLSEHEALTNKEIADTLQVSVDTVKIRLHRARARLKKELGSGCSFYRDERNELACEPKPKGVSPAD